MPRALILLLFMWSGAACAWGFEGHRIVGDIATRFLSPQARGEIAFLLAEDLNAGGLPSGRRTLGEVGSWADEIRDTPEGRASLLRHFDNVPLCGAADPRAYCANGECGSAQLASQLAVLRDRGRTRRERNEALKWVVHLVGDLHQPLHAADRGDRGGNRVEVSFFGERDNAPYGTLNLHSVWDVHLLQRVLRDQGGERAFVRVHIPEDERRAWQATAAEEWIAESHRLARAVVYSIVPPGLECSGEVTATLAIDERYYARAAVVIAARLRQAGVRLAALLNATLGR